jgi:hypothetical protein
LCKPVLKLSVLKQRLFLLVSITSTNDGSYPFIKHVGFLTIFVKSKISHKSSSTVGIPARRRFDIECKTLENIVYEVTLDKTKWLIYAIYRPPSMANDIFTNHMNRF